MRHYELMPCCKVVSRGNGNGKTHERAVKALVMASEFLTKGRSPVGADQADTLLRAVN